MTAEAIRLRVKVTSVGVERGLPSERACCPLALALWRALPGARYVAVYRERVRVRLTVNGKVLTARLPFSASEFVKGTDEWQAPPPPPEFELAFTPE